MKFPPTTIRFGADKLEIEALGQKVNLAHEPWKVRKRALRRIAGAYRKAYNESKHERNNSMKQPQYA